MKTLAIFVLALFAVVMAQNKINIIEDPAFSQPSAANPPQEGQQINIVGDPGFYRPSVGNPPQQGYQARPNGGGYRKEWAAGHDVSPYARGGK